MAAPQPIKPKAATASSEIAQHSASLAIDGRIDDASRWVSEKSAQPSWLAIDLGDGRKLVGVHLFSGYGAAGTIEDSQPQRLQPRQAETLHGPHPPGRHSLHRS
ncbi:MAG: discoidin domain-containing protein [Akkermansiaceae bacterium]